MAENIFSTFAISGQGLSVQRMRLSATANNIANANTTKGPDGQPYQREVVVVRPITGSPFDEALNVQIQMEQTDPVHSGNADDSGGPGDYRVLNAVTAHDSSPARLIYEPSHPDADSEGYIHVPNINIVTEMVEMISAQRAFEANTNVIEAAKNVARDSLEI